MRVRIAVGVALILLVVAVATGPTLLRPALSRWVWTQLSTRLERQFDAQLTVESFEVFLYPAVRVEGRGLRLHLREQPAGPPLIALTTFSVTTSFMRLWKGNLRSVSADGLTVSIPPDARPSLGRGTSSTAQPQPQPGTPAGALTIDEVVSTRAQVVIAPNNPAGVPLVFGVEDARLSHFSSAAPAQFQARVLNPRPRGEIEASGRFGPWQSHDPRKTALEGEYTLKQADMSVFKGLGGRLDSTGRFRGRLEEIAIDGITHMADFSVETGGHPMPLETTFVARVDGTNGNTYLDRVTARLGSSPIEASGEIAGKPGVRGKTIRLNVKMHGAELEDIITLVVRTQPTPMRGQLGLTARLELPPGDEPVLDTLKLGGQFTIRRGRFASDLVQDKVDELSRRGRGQPKNESIDNVLSEFSGTFALRRGVLELPSFQFAVRGAEVRLAGSYALRGERLGFQGELRLQAKISQTVTGVKSVLLRVIDPFFRKHGKGAVLPIRVGGTVTAPEFGLNLFGRKSRPVSAPASPSPGRLSPPPGF